MTKWLRIEVLGLIILALFVLFFSYLTYQPLESKDLIQKKRTLKFKPFYGEQGGDMPSGFIYFDFLEDNKRYYLIDCAYEMCNRDSILKLDSGTEVRVLHQKESIDKTKINIYELSVNDSILLRLDDYNKCHLNKWKLLIPIIIVLSIILFIGKRNI